MQKFETLRQPLLVFEVLGERKRERRLIPKIVAYLSCSAGRTHFALTNYSTSCVKCNEDNIKCIYCEKSFEFEDELEYHMNVHHREHTTW